VLLGARITGTGQAGRAEVLEAIAVTMDKVRRLREAFPELPVRIRETG